MLVLSRKLNEKIFIGDSIVLTVVEIDRRKVRLGIEAPRDLPIYREELLPVDHGESKAEADRMIFVLLARDLAAQVAIRAWIEERVRLGKNSWGDPQIADAIRCIEAMESHTKNAGAATT